MQCLTLALMLSGSAYDDAAKTFLSVLCTTATFANGIDNFLTLSSYVETFHETCQVIRCSCCTAGRDLCQRYMCCIGSWYACSCRPKLLTSCCSVAVQPHSLSESAQKVTSLSLKRLMVSVLRYLDNTGQGSVLEWQREERNCVMSMLKTIQSFPFISADCRLLDCEESLPAAAPVGQDQVETKTAAKEQCQLQLDAAVARTAASDQRQVETQRCRHCTCVGFAKEPPARMIVTVVFRNGRC